MSVRSENSVFHALRKIEARAERPQDHLTDDFGYPICPCRDCAEITSAMSDAYMAEVFAGNSDPDRLPSAAQQMRQQAEFDHDADGGWEHQEYQRDNRAGGGTRIRIEPRETLPMVASPSIVPDLD